MSYYVPRSIALLAGLLPALALAGEPAVPQPPSPLPLAWCLEQAAARSPEIAADAAFAEAAQARIGPAGALDDPRFRYEASNMPTGQWNFSSTPLSGHQLWLSQKLPFPGLLGSREGAARAGAHAAELDLTDRRVGVSAAVEVAWSELGFAQRALDITDRNLELLRQLTRVAETKYAVGTGLQQDVLRAQVELTRLLDERLRRRAHVERAEAALAALLDLPPDVPLARTAELDEPSPLPSIDAVLLDLERSSPRLLALESKRAEAERLWRAAELEGYPDFDFGLGYRARQSVRGDPVHGDDFVSARVTIRLPVDRDKWRAQVAERKALWRRARAAHRAERARLRDAVRARYADLRRADAELGLVRDGLVPQARQSLESNRSGYEVDKVDFLRLVDSQVRVFESELRLVRAVADRRVAFAALEAASGGALR